MARRWEAEQARVSPQQVRASNERQDQRNAACPPARPQWQSPSARPVEETRAAWAAFEALRNRDLDAMRADETLRRRLRFGPKEDVPALPPPPKWKPPEPEPPKTRWTLKDEGW